MTPHINPRQWYWNLGLIWGVIQISIAMYYSLCIFQFFSVFSVVLLFHTSNYDIFVFNEILIRRLQNTVNNICIARESMTIHFPLLVMSL